MGLWESQVYLGVLSLNLCPESLGRGPARRDLQEEAREGAGPKSMVTWGGWPWPLLSQASASQGLSGLAAIDLPGKQRFQEVIPYVYLPQPAHGSAQEAPLTREGAARLEQVPGHPQAGWIAGWHTRALPDTSLTCSVHA